MEEAMKTYLITGGAGFIGSNFIEYMLNKYSNIKIINVDKLTYAGNLENLRRVEEHSNYKFVKADICDKAAITKIFQENNIDYLVNFAAESHVDKSIMDPEIFVKTNILGTANLLNVAKEFWAKKEAFEEGKRFIQISTDEVYGSLGEWGYFTEKSPIDPHSPYSSSKASADLMVKAYYDTYKMPIIITRCSNNYGPYQYPEKLIPLIINNLLNKKEIPIYGDGLNVRDWIYVKDHCSAIDKIIKRGRVGEVYNIGGDSERTNLEIVRGIIKYVHDNFDLSVSDNLITYVEDRKGHDRRYAIDASKIKEEINWQPEVSFEAGIVETIHWYLNNKQWLENLKKT